MERTYVEQRKAGLYLTGTRVSLDSVVYAFERGSSPEEIQRGWPALSLEQVYGAITYYLANREAVDVYLRSAEQTYADSVPPMEESAPELYHKLQRARQTLSRHS